MEKICNVDVLGTLQAIAKQVLIRGWDDLESDKRTITQLARREPLEQQALVWLCHPCGTALYPESDTFVRGTTAYQDIQFYPPEERAARIPIYYYEIEISGEQQGMIQGNVYAMDSQRYAAFAKNALPPCPTEAELVSARKLAASQVRRMRMSLPSSSLDAHLGQLIQKQIDSEANRIAAILQNMDKPNDPHQIYHMAAVSMYFPGKTNSETMDALVAKLREDLQSPSLFLGNVGRENILCVFQHRNEHRKEKASIREQLAAAKAAQVEKPAAQHQRDQGAR